MSVTHATGEIRWGILGAANIARAQFLPGLREAGGGRAALVGGRELERARAFAVDHGVDKGVEGYAQVVESTAIDAVYIALPNSLHSEWTGRALQAGKAVLCEKPLSVSAGETAAVLDAASALPSALLWEAFVFPFQAQHQRLMEVLSDGAIGEPAGQGFVHDVWVVHDRETERPQEGVRGTDRRSIRRGPRPVQPARRVGQGQRRPTPPSRRG